ncbi:esterase/lipase family protein [Actinophytocola glycyrrhizae]|uniref:Esterase/lipase family protein n=1 Tax=Actinophytocola glycyrrhizae TaxID=2044873 RepID=A0ABV9SFC4_9PSEU
MMLRRALSTVALTIAVAGSALAGGTPAAADPDPGPELHSFVAAFGYSITRPDLDPPGANDWSCRPSARHPRPVVLVHGTWENRYNNFAQLSPALKRDGYCVFALNYGDTDDNLLSQPEFVKGNGDIRTSAKELAAFVDRVRAATGTAKVDIVGHSQGGMMPRQYLRFEGGAEEVATLVTLGATHHGTTLSGIGTFARTLGLLGFTPPILGRAAEQQVVGSDFLTTLNAGGDTVPGVSYVVIATRYDEVTTPYRSTFLTAGPGATVKNITLQDGCPIDLSDHLSMTYSWRAVGYVRRALDPAAPPAPCLPNAPVV